MKKIVSALVIVFFALVANAQIEKPVTWVYTAKKISATEYELHITATIQSKWHVYSQKTGEGPVPTSFVFDKNPLLTIDGTTNEVGKLEQKFDPNFKSVMKYFSQKVDFVQKVKLKSAINTIAKGKVTFMSCNDEKCLAPTTVPFSIKINGKS
jgi:hypothetical protein